MSTSTNEPGPAFSDFLEMVKDAAHRSRFMIYLGITAALSFAAVIPVVAPNDWTYARMNLYRTAYAIALLEQEGKLSRAAVRNPELLVSQLRGGPGGRAENDILQYLSPGYRWRLNMLRPGSKPDVFLVDASIAAINCWASNSPGSTAGESPTQSIRALCGKALHPINAVDDGILEQFLDSRGMTDGESTANGLTAAFGDRGLYARINELEKSYAATRRVKIPIISIEYDIFDFIIIGGIAMCVISYLLFRSLSREVLAIRQAELAAITVGELDLILLTQAYNGPRIPGFLTRLIVYSSSVLPMVLYFVAFAFGSARVLSSGVGPPEWDSSEGFMGPFLRIPIVIPPHAAAFHWGGTVVLLMSGSLACFVARAWERVDRALLTTRHRSFLPRIPSTAVELDIWIRGFERVLLENRQCFVGRRGGHITISEVEAICASLKMLKQPTSGVGRESGRYIEQLDWEFRRTIRPRIRFVNLEAFPPLAQRMYFELMQGRVGLVDTRPIPLDDEI